MAKLDLCPGEAIIGSGQMSLFLRQGLFRRPFQGNVFVTNQRTCFKTGTENLPEMDLSIGEIRGFKVYPNLLVTKVTIRAKDGHSYPLTGFPTKKLQNWLEEAGVKRL